MDPTQQQLSQEWQGYLQQVSDRFTQIMQQTDAGCRQLLQTHPDDVMPTERALGAVHAKVDELKQEVWDNRKQSNGPVDVTHELVRWIDESWDRAEVNWKWTAYKAMWPRVQQLMTQPVPCTQCGAPLTPAVRTEMDRVTCSNCGVVNEISPDPKVQTYYLQAPDLWAQASTFEQRLAADRQKSLAEKATGAEALLQWEKMERDYWTAYFATKAQVLPASPDQQQKDVEKRMGRILDELSYKDAWREAKGMAPTVKLGRASGPVPGGDDWGPLRPDEVEEFYYQSSRLENARNDPEGFQALLQRFGYRDSAHFEHVRQTFKRHLDESDEAVLQGSISGRQRAMQDELLEKAQSDPGLAPVEGVTLEEYADIAAQQPKLSPAELEQLLAQHGMDMVKFSRVAYGWIERTKGGGAVGMALYKALQAAQQRLAAAGGGSDPSKCTFEHYCEVTGAFTVWAEQGKDVNAMLKQEFNLTTTDFSALGSFWMKKMQADPGLMLKMGDLVAAAKLKYMAR